MEPIIIRTTPINWTATKYAIQHERTILFLGPKAILSTEQLEEQNKFLTQTLENNPREVISFHEQDGFLIFNNENAKDNLIYTFSDFYKKDFTNPLLSQLAAIPFHLIVSVLPDKTMNNIFKTANYDFQHSYYNRKQLRNVEPPTKDKPLLYNLLGCVEDDETLILSHRDLYKTLRAIDHGETFPKTLKSTIQKAQNIIFLGFDDERWYMPFVLHLLELDKNPRSYYSALNGLKDAMNKAIVQPDKLLYHSKFKMQFVNQNMSEFVETLCQQFSADERRKPKVAATIQKEYNIRNISRLISSAMNAEDLSWFCEINYETVFDEFTAEMNKSGGIRELIRYVQRQDGFEELLALMKEENSVQYTKNQPYYDIA
jgi:hypothetical protein